MPDLELSWPWITLAALGAFHGLNPAMGWLFAVALGLQERRWRAVPAALALIAVGHALAIALAVVAVGLLGLILPAPVTLGLGGAALLGFAAYRIASRFRHPRWVGMRVRPWELIVWSFLMASAHGAGLMLTPIFLAGQTANVPATLAHANHGGLHPGAAEGAVMPALLAVGVHTGAMLIVAGILALVVYACVGVEVLRRVWINLDVVWAGALAVTGCVTLGNVLWPMAGS